MFIEQIKSFEDYDKVYKSIDVFEKALQGILKYSSNFTIFTGKLRDSDLTGLLACILSTEEYTDVAHDILFKTSFSTLNQALTDRNFVINVFSHFMMEKEKAIYLIDSLSDSERLMYEIQRGI